jgi:ankyrin repeat protein
MLTTISFFSYVYRCNTYIQISNIDVEGRTTLHRSVIYFCEHQIPEILSEGSVDPDAHDRYGCTALDYAIDSGKSSTVSMLIKDKRVNVNNVSSCYTPLTRAIMRNDKDIVGVLLSRMDIDVYGVCYDEVTYDNYRCLDFINENDPVSLEIERMIRSHCPSLYSSRDRSKSYMDVAMSDLTIIFSN